MYAGGPASVNVVRNLGVASRFVGSVLAARGLGG